MKCLVIGDPHFKVSNTDDVDVFISKISSLIKERDPNFIVVLGDVLDTHERIHITPFNKVVKFLDEIAYVCKKKVFVLIGNHDLINNQQFLTENHGFNAFKKWKNVTIVDTVIEYKPDDNLTFVFCPYVPPGRFQEALNSDPSIMWESADCIFAHQEFHGCKMGAIVSEVGDKWNEDLPPVISGHIHDSQILKNIHYVGSGMQHAFGETSKKHVWMLDFEVDEESEDKFNIEKINLGLKRRTILKMDIDDIENIDKKNPMKKPLSEILENNYIKLDLKGTNDQFTKFRKSPQYKELSKMGIKIKFSPIIDDINKIKKSLKKSGTINRGFTNILKELLKDENKEVMDIYNEVVNDGNNNKVKTLREKINMEEFENINKEMKKMKMKKGEEIELEV
jgi:DNA repair exonuclease SbcCD nuclease subunit